MASAMYRQDRRRPARADRVGSGRAGHQLRDRDSSCGSTTEASRNTVRDAIKWLTGLGLVETRPGQGTFVVKKIDPFVTTLVADPRTGDSETYQFEVTKKNRQPDLSGVQVEIQKANAELADRLRLPEGSQVISRHQKRLIDETPFSLQTSFYPRDLADRGAKRLSDADDIEGGAVSTCWKPWACSKSGIAT